MLPASSAWLTPAAASTAMLSTVPSRPNNRWAVSRVNRTVRLPARLSASPKVATPTTVTSVGPDTVSTVVRSPGARSASSASERSTTTSSPARGPRPVTSRNGLSRSDPVQAAPAGAAPMPMSSTASPSGPTTWAYPSTRAATCSTPSMPATCSTRDSSTGACWVPVKPSIVAGPRTSASVCRSASAKTPARLARMVSVKTMDPAMKATPSRTATTVETSRRLWLRSPRSVRVSTAQPSRFFMWSSTRSGVGSVMSSTTWPSARKTTRSA